MKFPFLLLLFLILLFSLLLFSYYGYVGQRRGATEGFISFQADKNPLAGDVVIPTYSPSSRVFKLYDNLFFDNTNGNLIQANGVSIQGNTAPSSTGLADPTGKTLSSIVVYNRDSSVGSVTIDTQIQDGSITNAASLQSQKTGYDVSFSQFLISSNNANVTDNYQTLYVSWGSYTFIDVINTSVTPPKTLLGALFSDTELRGNLLPVPYVVDDTNNIKIVPAQYVADSNDGKTNVQTWYGNNRLYQICSFLFFDTINGNLVLRKRQETGNPTVLALYRSFQPITSSNFLTVEKYIPSVGYAVHSIQFNPNETGSDPQFFIYYVGFGQRTMVIVLRKQAQSSDLFKIVTVARFDKDGFVEAKNKTVEPAEPGDTKKKNGRNWGNGYDISQADMDLLGVDFLLADQIDYIQQNYVRKSDLVPPIYPTVLSCSSCNGGGGGVCTNCGGNGGSGTQGVVGGNTLASGVSNSFNTAVSETAGLGKEVVGGGVDLGKSALDLGKQAVVGTVDLGKDVVGGAVNLTEKGVSGAVDVTGKLVGGAVDLGRETVGGAVSLGRETVGGAVDLTKQGVSGAVNELNYLTSIPGGGGVYPGSTAGYMGSSGIGPNGGVGNSATGVPIRYNNGGTVPGVDPYSGYGSMVSKGSDFMPLTASFSAFGK